MIQQFLSYVSRTKIYCYLNSSYFLKNFKGIKELDLWVHFHNLEDGLARDAIYDSMEVCHFMSFQEEPVLAVSVDTL